MVIQKQYARRTIDGYVSPYPDRFRYLSISELDIDEVLRLFSNALLGTMGRDLNPAEPAEELKFIIEFAGDAYHPETWVVAYDSEMPIGMIFAQRYADKPLEGSLFFIGVLPEHRGKGFGGILHAKGLEMLAAIGVKEYVGSTDVNNEPMLQVFKANDCRLYAIRDVKVKVGLV